MQYPDLTHNSFSTFDGIHYIHLAKEGYTAGHFSCAFYPLWPAVLWVGDKISGGHYIIAGVILANLLSIAGLTLCYLWLRQRFGEKIALGTMVIMLAFPGSIFLSFIYTEPLFFLLASLFLWSLDNEHYDWATLAAFLMPLTKAIGLLMVLPILVNGYLRKGSPIRLAVGFAPIAGFLCYLGIIYSFTGNAWEGFDAQRFYPTKPKSTNLISLEPARAFIFPFIRLLEAKEGTNIEIHNDAKNSLIDRTFFLAFLASLPWIWKLDKTLFAFSLVVGLVPALSTLFLSYTRFLSCCIPVFIVWAMKLPKMIYWYLVGVFALVQVWFLWRQLSYLWVG